MIDLTQYRRRATHEVRIGACTIGGTHPVAVQSMTNTDTRDTAACVAQIERIARAGAPIVRLTAQGVREAENLRDITERLRADGNTTALVADIHFLPEAAAVAAQYVDKVRINPGNYRLDRGELEVLVARCRERGVALRIGVNHGSLSKRIFDEWGDTPEGMVAAAMEFLHVCRREAFDQVVVSMKSSNTRVMVAAYRLLVEAMEREGMTYPIHLGVTEAGNGLEGRIKSAVGIGALLADGIGDTIRVSLSEDPEAEIPVARKLVDYILEREGHEPVEASPAPGYDPVTADRRHSRVAERIGGNFPPVVISDRSNGDFEFDHASQPDYIYIGKEDPENLPDNFRLLVDAHFWKERPNAYPFFIASEIDELKDYSVPLKFIRLTYRDLTDRVIEVLKQDKSVIVILSTHHRNGIAAERAAMHHLLAAGCDVPVILHRDYRETDIEALQLKAAVDFGTLLLDGFGDGIMLHNEGCETMVTDSCMFGILQATRTRISKTEYISCPSCGRTLYDLQTTIARIKKATSHLKGLKIGIMGCIVNGPGEMADADYGYVGAGKNRISLYKGKECVLKNIPEEEAVERLVQLIKESGDWTDH